MHTRRGRALTAAAVATLLMGAGAGDARAQTETTPPVLDVATLSPTPATGHNGWYRTSPVTLNMTASDASGIDRFEYAFAAAGPWTPVAAVNGAGSVAISQQGLGNNAVRYRAIDANVVARVMLCVAERELSGMHIYESERIVELSRELTREVGPPLA